MKHNLRIKPNVKKKKAKKKSLKRDQIVARPRNTSVEIIKRKDRKRSIKIKNHSYDNRKYLPLSKWKNKLKDVPAFILGNAPSISDQPLSLLNSYFTIGVNRIFYIYEPTVLFWQDRELWRSNQHNLLVSKSIRVCRDFSDPRRMFLNFKLGHYPFRFSMNPEKLYGRGNSGIIAVQFAVALGCRHIVLLGTDCKYGSNKKTDFYGKNKDHKSYTLKMCNKSMKWLKDHPPEGVKIYNCSKNDLWPERKLADVIKEIRPEKFDKKYFHKIFAKK